MRVLTKRQKILTLAGMALLLSNTVVLLASFVGTDKSYILYTYLPVCSLMSGYAVGKVIWMFGGDKEEKHPVEE